MIARSIHRARMLRRNQTDAERKLWQRLRGRQIVGAKFRRQEPIGPYIVDFCCVEHKVVIEVDGGQHAEREEPDLLRSEFLAHSGYWVLRFWNNEVLEDTAAVLECISRVLAPPHPDPLPAGEGTQRKGAGTSNPRRR